MTTKACRVLVLIPPACVRACVHAYNVSLSGSPQENFGARLTAQLLDQRAHGVLCRARRRAPWPRLPKYARSSRKELTAETISLRIRSDTLGASSEMRTYSSGLYVCSWPHTRRGYMCAHGQSHTSMYVRVFACAPKVFIST